MYAYVLGRACENFLNEVPPIYPGPVRIDRIAFATVNFKIIHVFIWLPWVLVVALRIFTASCGIFYCGAQTL